MSCFSGSNSGIPESEDGSIIDWLIIKKVTNIIIYSHFECGNHQERFDLTVPATRYAIEHFSDLVFPFRRYQIQKVYRGERPQDGKFNEFYQADIDIFGNDTIPISADVEILTTINYVLWDLDIGWYTIHLNNKRVWVWLLQNLGIDNNEKQNVILSIVDKSPKVWKDITEQSLFEAIAPENSQKIIRELTIDGKVPKTQEILDELRSTKEIVLQSAIRDILELTFSSGKNPEKIIESLRTIDNKTLQVWLQELDIVYSQALALWVPKERLIIDRATIRGLNYYTGTIYETFLDWEEWLGSICSGGRYDDLASLFSKNKRLPWVGVSIWVSRLLSRLLKKGKYTTVVKTPSKVLVTRLQKEYEIIYLWILGELRKAWIPSELYLESDAKLGKQIWYADKKWIPYAIIAGEDEISKGEVQLKHMYTWDKEQISIEHISKRVKELLLIQTY